MEKGRTYEVAAAILATGNRQLLDRVSSPGFELCAGSLDAAGNRSCSSCPVKLSKCCRAAMLEASQAQVERQYANSSPAGSSLEPYPAVSTIVSTLKPALYSGRPRNTICALCSALHTGMFNLEQQPRSMSQNIPETSGQCAESRRGHVKATPSADTALDMGSSVPGRPPHVKMPRVPRVQWTPHAAGGAQPRHFWFDTISRLCLLTWCPAHGRVKLQVAAAHGIGNTQSPLIDAPSRAVAFCKKAHSADTALHTGSSNRRRPPRMRSNSCGSLSS